MIGVKKNIFGSFINVTSTDNDNILVGRLSLGDLHVRIIACYAPQEVDLKDDREKFFEDLSIEVEKSKLSSDGFLVIGDLNAKLDWDSSYKWMYF